MLHTWKRVVLSSSALALMLAFGAPIQAGDDDDDNGPDTIVERDRDLIKVTHIIRARTGGGSGTTDPGYTWTGWKWYTPIKFYLYTDSVTGAGLSVTDTTASLQNSFLAWLTANPKIPTVSSEGRTGNLPTTFAKFSNGDNEIGWKKLGSRSTIAATYTWFSNGTAVEFDMAFNTAFPWSNAGEAKKMDVQNIGTHEVGHVYGMGHTTFSDQYTMYPYANYGETIRQTLEAGDITGIQLLYQ